MYAARTNNSCSAFHLVKRQDTHRLQEVFTFEKVKISEYLGVEIIAFHEIVDRDCELKQTDGRFRIFHKELCDTPRVCQRQAAASFAAMLPLPWR